MASLTLILQHHLGPLVVSGADSLDRVTRYEINKPAVERYAGYARALAHSVENHADNAGLLTDRERAYHRGVAAQILQIADGITAAAAAADQPATRRWWRYGLAAAAGFGASIGVGVGESAGNAIGDAGMAYAIEDESVTRCAADLVEHGRAVSPVVSIVELSASASAALRATANATATNDRPGLNDAVDAFAETAETEAAAGDATVDTTYGYSLTAHGTVKPAEVPEPSSTGRDLKETILDVVGIDDSVVKGLAETATASVDLDDTVKDLAEVASRSVDGDSVAALAGTGRATASGGDATVTPPTIEATVDIPTPKAGRSIPEPGGAD